MTIDQLGQGLTGPDDPCGNLLWGDAAKRFATDLHGETGLFPDVDGYSKVIKASGRASTPVMGSSCASIFYNGSKNNRCLY